MAASTDSPFKFLCCVPTHQLITELPTLPDSAEDFLIFRENKLIRVHKFDNLPDSGNILYIELYVIVILKIFLIGEENLPDCMMQMLVALSSTGTRYAVLLVTSVSSAPCAEGFQTFAFRNYYYNPTCSSAY